jgi:hypothetical protein
MTHDVPGNQFEGVVSPDGERFFYNSDHEGSMNLYVRPASGGVGDGELLWKDDDYDLFAQSASPDGEHLLYLATPRRRGDLQDMWILRLSGDPQSQPEPVPFLPPPHDSSISSRRRRAVLTARRAMDCLYLDGVGASGGVCRPVSIHRHGRTRAGSLRKEGRGTRWRGDGGEIFYCEYESGELPHHGRRTSCLVATRSR